MKDRLLFVDQYAGLAGAERILLAVATAPEIRKDWDVTFALPEDGWLARELRSHGVTVALFLGSNLHYGKKTFADYLRFLFKFVHQVFWFRHLIRETGTQLIYMSTPRYLPHLIFATLRQPVRIVYHVQCTYKGLVQQIMRTALRSSKVACVVSSSRSADLWVRSLVPSGKLVVCVPNWTTLPNGEAQSGTVTRNIELFTLRERPFRFAVIGRIVSIKGQDLFLQAARRLLMSGAPAEFHVVGSGACFEPDFERALRSEFGNLPGINFVGHVDNIADIYRRVSCVVIPSREEAFGLVAIEAMSYGIPIIVSDVGELPEIVDHGTSGLIFNSDNLEDLVATMTRIMHDSVLARDLSVRALQRVSVHYSGDVSLQRIGLLLRDLSDKSDSRSVRSGHGRHSVHAKSTMRDGSRV
ncbi:MAG: hypothetical protein AUI89_05445 [Gemmatimonadetes bacterium 13_1_40CM_3_65_8]|nr:MAG: hypothetical protein AUH75_01970 [Gemmatimonadetes bacterium 13_1_40CM_4_65_7]OLD00775.1 MAG: hypothetical protein AUI89_05445 [Gemmatimonadetes bacterium 13_1_40CM_3_65_8]